jgi:glutaconate CoA-transferase, subunit B
MDFSADEIMVVCISRQIHDGEMVVQGLATPLVAAAYLLARYTHAPNLYFASAIGQSLCRQPAPLGLRKVESLWLDRSMTNVGFVRVAADVLPSLKPKEFFRPGQVDSSGNFNNIAIGKDYLTTGRLRPRLRLPGSGGIPDVTTYINDTYMYVPRHSRVTFVEKLDVLSGLGHHPARTHGAGPRYLISDLGQFDFEGSLDSVDDPFAMGSQRCMRLISCHPGISVEKIQSHTGFELQVSPALQETLPPTDDELHLLREVIDPLGIRKLESLSGAARRQLLHKILETET